MQKEAFIPLWLNTVEINGELVENNKENTPLKNHVKAYGKKQLH